MKYGLDITGHYVLLFSTKILPDRCISGLNHIIRFKCFAITGKATQIVTH